MKQWIHCWKWRQEVLWHVLSCSVRWAGPEVSGGGAEGGARRPDCHTGTTDRSLAQHAVVWAQPDRDPHLRRGRQVRGKLLELQLWLKFGWMFRHVSLPQDAGRVLWGADEGDHQDVLLSETDHAVLGHHEWGGDAADLQLYCNFISLSVMCFVRMLYVSR